MKKKILLLIGTALLFFAVTTMAQVPSYVPSNGLVGWWPFSGNANDLSNNANNGTVNGATLTTDRFGNANSAYNFNGSSNFIQIPNTTLLNPSLLTISIWIQANGYYNGLNGSNYIISKGFDGTQGHYGIAYETSTKQFFFEIGNVAAGGYVISKSIITQGNWFHVCGTYDGSSLKIYINGMLDSNITATGNYSLGTNTEPLFLGENYSSTYPYWVNGKIDEIGIWNRALTQAEITLLYQGCNLSVTTNPINQNVYVGSNAQFVLALSDTSATYHWQSDLGLGFQNISNAGQYSGATNDTLIVSNTTLTNNNQQFRCIVTSGTCADTSSIAILSVINNVGINEATNSLFKVYPNPANNQINVEINKSLIGSIFTITDQIGKTILSGKLTKENSIIELGDLSGGIYLLSIGNNAKQTFKVIKK